MNTNLDVSIHNKFEFELREAVTGVLKQSCVAYNIVLDAMWSKLVNRTAFLYAHTLWYRYWRIKRSSYSSFYTSWQQGYFY